MISLLIAFHASQWQHITEVGSLHDDSVILPRTKLTDLVCILAYCNMIYPLGNIFQTQPVTRL